MNLRAGPPLVIKKNNNNLEPLHSRDSLFFLLCALAGELWEPADPSSSSLGSFFTSGFLSSAAEAADNEDAEEDAAVSMGSALQPSPEGFSCFISEQTCRRRGYSGCAASLAARSNPPKLTKSCREI